MPEGTADTDPPAAALPNVAAGVAAGPAATAPAAAAPTVSAAAAAESSAAAPGSAEDNPEEDTSDEVLFKGHVMKLNHRVFKGCWGSTRRTQHNTRWGFMVPASQAEIDCLDANDESKLKKLKENKAKHDVITCWFCHLLKTGRVHENTPKTGACAISDDEVTEIEELFESLVTTGVAG